MPVSLVFFSSSREIWIDRKRAKDDGCLPKHLHGNSKLQQKKITPYGNGLNGIRIETLFLFTACRYTLFSRYSHSPWSKMLSSFALNRLFIDGHCFIWCGILLPSILFFFYLAINISQASWEMERIHFFSCLLLTINGKN